MRMTRPMLVMLWLLAAATIWNAAFEVAAPSSLRSLRIHRSDALYDLVQVEQASLKQGFDIYLLLRQIGGDRTVVAPPGFLYSDRLDGLSDMTLEVDPAGGPQLTEDQVDSLLSLPGLDGWFDLGDPSVERRLHIVIPSPAERRLRLVLTASHAIVVGESTLGSVLNHG